MWGLRPFIWLIIVVVVTVACIVLMIWQPIKQSLYGSDIAKIEKAAQMKREQEEKAAKEEEQSNN